MMMATIEQALQIAAKAHEEQERVPEKPSQAWDNSPALPGIGAMMSLSRGTGNGGFSREMEWFSPAVPRRR